MRVADIPQPIQIDFTRQDLQLSPRKMHAVKKDYFLNLSASSATLLQGFFASFRMSTCPEAVSDAGTCSRTTICTRRRGGDVG